MFHCYCRIVALVVKVRALKSQVVGRANDRSRSEDCCLRASGKGSLEKSIEDEEQNINTSKLQTVRSDGLFEITNRDLLISDCAKQLSYSAT